MSALNRLSGALRSQKVVQDFVRVAEAHDGRARVTYLHYSGERVTVEGHLVTLGWNPTHSGTQEAVIFRPETSGHRLAADLIPFTRLIAIEPPKAAS